MLELDRHVRTQLEKARDFQRRRADRGWALYERACATVIDLQEITIPDLHALLRRFLNQHCAASDAEGTSALCECRLCRETRAALGVDDQ